MTTLNMDFETQRKQYEVSEAKDWYKAVEKVPFLVFPSSWRVQILPPFGAVDARFLVQQGEARVSVYLDLHCTTGLWGGPYWEIYPDVEDDAIRFDLEDTEGLMGGIGASLLHQRETP